MSKSLKVAISSLMFTSAIYANEHSHMDHSVHQTGANEHIGHHHEAKFLNSQIDQFQRKLPLPPLVNGNFKDGVRNFDIEVKSGQWEFIDGKLSKTYGYNGAILGPILVMNQNEPIKVNIKNSLNEETTVHFHGAVVPESADGVFNAEIYPDKTKEVEFNLNQPAATLWYHPHTMHKTAGQVYKGLAGLIYLNDEASKNLNIPKTYGIDDFPIVIQDKEIGQNGELEYKTDAQEKLHGKSGGYLLINGIASPFVDIPNGIVRLRVLNGSNATDYKINFGGAKFYQVASDGGFLSAPVGMSELNLTQGERAEILIDSTKLKDKSYMFVNEIKALEMIKSKDGFIKEIPQTLVEIPEINSDLTKLNSREFELMSTQNGNFINGKLHDMDITDFRVKKGQEEIWEIKNGATMHDMAHSFHIHGAQFRILSRDGKTPPLNEQGFKDTLNIQPNETVKLLVKFDTTGMMVYHCHNLEHEESGMMGQFEILPE